MFAIFSSSLALERCASARLPGQKSLPGRPELNCASVEPSLLLAMLALEALDLGIEGARKLITRSARQVPRGRQSVSLLGDPVAHDRTGAAHTTGHVALERAVRAHPAGSLMRGLVTAVGVLFVADCLVDVCRDLIAVG